MAQVHTATLTSETALATVLDWTDTVGSHVLITIEVTAFSGTDCKFRVTGRDKVTSSTYTEPFIIKDGEKTISAVTTADDAERIEDHRAYYDQVKIEYVPNSSTVSANIWVKI